MTILFFSRMIWPNNVKSKFFVVIILLLLIFIPLTTFVLQKKSSKSSVEEPNATPFDKKDPSIPVEVTATEPVSEPISPQDKKQLDSIPFYPGLSWIVDDKQELGTDIKDRVIYYSSKNTFGHFGMSGKEWAATKQNISKEELYKMEGDFTNYYNDKLTALGWASSIETNGFLLKSMAADGPSGGIWGYIKVENGMLSAIILQKKTPISLFGPGSSDPCPCDITFQMFVSNPQDLTEVLPTSP